MSKDHPLNHNGKNGNAGLTNESNDDGDRTTIPEGLKRAFRKWNDRSVGMCEVLDLQDALEGCV